MKEACPLFLVQAFSLGRESCAKQKLYLLFFYLEYFIYQVDYAKMRKEYFRKLSRMCGTQKVPRGTVNFILKYEGLLWTALSICRRK